MRAPLVLASLLTFTPSPFGGVTPHIVGGARDVADPAVVALDISFWPSCSGVLIGPRTVLTAGHCVMHIPLLSTYVAFGASAWSPDRKVKVVQSVQHPRYAGEGKPFDLALLELETPVTDIAPVPVSSAAMGVQDVGSAIRHIGYGATSDWYPIGLGAKRSVSYPITQVTADFVYSGAPGKQTCDGDSGGPGLRPDASGGERVVSITSDGPNCHAVGWDSRVDPSAAWIATVQAQWDAPAPAQSASPPPSASPSTPRKYRRWWWPF